MTPRLTLVEALSPTARDPRGQVFDEHARWLMQGAVDSFARLVGVAEADIPRLVEKCKLIGEPEAVTV